MARFSGLDLQDFVRAHALPEPAFKEDRTQICMWANIPFTCVDTPFVQSLINDTLKVLNKRGANDTAYFVNHAPSFVYALDVNAMSHLNLWEMTQGIEHDARSVTFIPLHEFMDGNVKLLGGDSYVFILATPESMKEVTANEEIMALKRLFVVVCDRREEKLDVPFYNPFNFIGSFFSGSTLYTFTNVTLFYPSNDDTMCVQRIRYKLGPVIAEMDLYNPKYSAGQERHIEALREEVRRLKEEIKRKDDVLIQAVGGLFGVSTFAELEYYIKNRDDQK